MTKPIVVLVLVAVFTILSLLFEYLTNKNQHREATQPPEDDSFDVQPEIIESTAKLEDYCCKICLSDPINCILQPCRHSLCGKCATIIRNSTNKCPICRKKINSLVPFFVN